MKLSLSEEILLLCVDDQSGRLRPMPDRALDYALAGAVLADLEMRGHIALGEDLVQRRGDAAGELQPVHATALKLLPESESSTLQSCLSLLAGENRTLRETVFDQLIERGILARVRDEVLWIFRTERYETLDLSEEIEVQQRIRAVVLDAERKPSREELVLVALMEVCQLGPLMFSHAEFEQHRDRIRDLANCDCIGCAVRHALTEIQRAMLEIRAYSGM